MHANLKKILEIYFRDKKDVSLSWIEIYHSAIDSYVLRVYSMQISFDMGTFVHKYSIEELHVLSPPREA